MDQPNEPIDRAATQRNENSSSSAVPAATTTDPADLLSPLEHEVLQEYARLAGNLENLSSLLADLASKPSAEILDALRGLERQTVTVFTSLKSSVYSIVVQQGIYGADGVAGG